VGGVGGGGRCLGGGLRYSGWHLAWHCVGATVTYSGGFHKEVLYLKLKHILTLFIGQALGHLYFGVL